MLLTGSARAADRPARVMLVLLPGTDAADLLGSLDEPGRGSLRAQAGLALLNAAVPGPDVRESAYRAVATGRRAAAGHSGARDSSAGEDLSVGAILRRAGRAVGYIGPRDDRGLPAGSGRACVAGAAGLPAATSSPGPPAEAPQEWRPVARQMLAHAELVVADLPSGTRPGPALDVVQALLAELNPRQDLLLMVSPDPRRARDGQWTRLPAVAAWATGLAGRLLVSAGTRTPGMLANVDVAPTVLAWLGVDRPPGMEGRPARAAEPGGTTRLSNVARRAARTQNAMAPVLIVWAALCGAAVAGALWAAGCGSAGSRVRTAGRLVLAAALCGPVLFLYAALDPAQVGVLRTLLAVLPVVPGLWMAWRTGVPQGGVWLGLVLLAGLDLLLGTRMLAENVMSNFPNVGARFYGIGNEYLGLVQAAALLLPFYLAEREGSWSARLRAATFAGWGALLVVVGWPGWGADFGGALALVVGYGWAVRTLSAPRCVWRPRPREIVVALAGLTGIGLALVGLDLLRPPESRTHVGQLAVRLVGGEFGPSFELIGRKMALNLQMLHTPYALGGLAIVAPLVIVWYHARGAVAWEVLRGRIWLRGGVESVAVGGLAALVLNDTGVVAASLAWGTAFFLWLDVLLQE